MTIWVPNIDLHAKDRPAPRYLAIAEAISSAVGNGELSDGERLPTHRDLAYRLGVTVGTVSRAYSEAERRGLVTGEVGRGTYVREKGAIGTNSLFVIPERNATNPSLIDLGLNVPVWNVSTKVVARYLDELSKDDENLASLLRYQTECGTPEHRAVGALWLEGIGLKAAPERILLTCGTQHSLITAFMAITEPGDLIVAEGLTYPALKGLAHQLRLRLSGLAMDSEGIIPDAFERACFKDKPKALYCIPTQQNPTTATMSEGRRKAIAAIAERHGVFIIEDDVYGFFPEDRPPPIAAYAPDITFLATSISKYMLGGMRCGFLVSPDKFVRMAGDSIRASMWFAPPLSAEIVSRIITDGAFAEMLSWLRKELEIRNEMVRRIMHGQRCRSIPTSYHAWVELPDPWRGEELVTELRRLGVTVMSSETFAIDRGPQPHAIRICLCGEADRAKIAQGLEIIAKTLNMPPSPGPSVI